MHRFFVKYEIKTEDVIIDHMDDVKHLTKSLRVTVGEKIEICDSKGLEYIAEVTSLEDIVLCKVIKKRDIQRESPLKVDLIQGLAKGSKMELIIQKAVELGVHQVIPCQMKRSIVKLDKKAEKKKVERWQKIADEAGKQSKRSNLPKVSQVMPLMEMESILKAYDHVMIAYENETTRHLKSVLKGFGNNIAVIIGPEGGFTEEEVTYIQSLGGHAISLGPRILRTETAGLMCLSILQYELGDISE